MAAQFDFVISTEVKQIQELVNVFKQLDTIIRTLSSNKYNIDVKLSSGTESQLNKIKEALSSISNKSYDVKVHVDQGKLDSELSKTKEKIDTAFNTANITPSYITQTLSKTVNKTIGARGEDFRKFNNVSDSPLLKDSKRASDAINQQISTLGRNGESLQRWSDRIKKAGATLNAFSSQIGKVKAALEKKNSAESNSIKNIETHKKVMQQLDAMYNTLNGRLNVVKTQYDSVARAERRAINEQERMSRDQADFDKRLGLAIGKLIRYRIAFAAMQKVAQAFTGTFKNFEQIQTGLAQIAKVINPTVSQLEALKKEAFSLGQAYGSSIKDVVDAMKVWAQTGLRGQEITAAANATLVAQAAVGFDAVQATEALTAAIFIYGVEAKNVTDVVDKWIAVQAKYPVTAQDLANALQRVGSAAVELGVDLDHLNAIVATIGTVTRKTGTEVGTSLKTILARLPRDETIKLFNSIGIASYKTTGELRDMQNVIEDLAAKWSSLNDIQRRNVAQQLGGVRRYVDVLALLSNYAIAQQAVIDSELSYGSAARATQYELNTLANEMQRIEAVFTQLSEGVGGDLVTGLADFLTALSSIGKWINSNPAIEKLVAVMAGLGITVLTTTGVYVGLQYLLAKTQAAFTKNAAAAAASAVAMEGAGTGAATAATGVTSLNIAFNGLLITVTSVVGIIGLIISYLTLTKHRTDDVTRSTNYSVESFKKLSEEIVNNYSAHLKQIELLKRLDNEREQLISRLNRETLTEKQLARVQEELTAKNRALANTGPELSIAMQQIGSSVDRTSEAYKNYKTVLESVIGQQKEAIKINKLQLEVAIAPYRDDEGALKKRVELVKENQEAVEKFMRSLNGLQIIMTNSSGVFGNEYKKGSLTASEALNITAQSLDKLMDTQDEFQKNIKQTMKAIEIDASMGANLFGTKAYGQDIKSYLDPNSKKAIIAGFTSLGETISIEFNKKLEAIGLGALPKEIQDEAKTTVKNIGFEFADLGNVIANAKNQEEINFALTKLLSGLPDKFDSLKKAGGDAFGALFNELAKLSEYEKALKFENIDDYIKSLIGEKTPDSKKIFGDLFDPKKLATFKDKLDEINFAMGQGSEIEIKYAQMMASLSGEAPEVASILYKITQSSAAQQKDLTAEILSNMTKVKNDVISLTKGTGQAWEEAAKQAADNIGKEFGEVKDFAHLSEEQIKIVQERLKNEGVIPKLQQQIAASNSLLSIAAKISAERLREEAQAIREINKQIVITDHIISNVIKLNDDYVGILKNVGYEEKDLLRIQLDRLTKLQKYLQVKRDAETSGEIQKRYEQQINDVLGRRIDIMAQMQFADFSKLKRFQVQFAEGMTSALSNAFNSIPDILVDNSSKRTDLERSIAERQNEILQATYSGDRGAIIEAQNELETLTKKLERYKNIFFQTGQVAVKAIEGLGQSLYKDMTERLSKELSKSIIKIDESDLKPIELSARKLEQSVNNSGITFRRYSNDSGESFYEYCISAGDVLVSAANKFAEIILESQKKSSEEVSASFGEFSDYIRASSQKYGVPADLIHAVIQRESSGNPNAVNKGVFYHGRWTSDATGLMQLQPGTAKEMGITPQERFDPAKNIDAGTKYLSQKILESDGNIIEALARYHFGSKNVDDNGMYSYMMGDSDFRSYVYDIMDNTKRNFADVEKYSEMIKQNFINSSNYSDYQSRLVDKQLINVKGLDKTSGIIDPLIQMQRAADESEQKLVVDKLKNIGNLGEPIKKSIEEAGNKNKKAATDFNKIIKLSADLFSSIIGQSLGAAIGGGGPSASRGAALGSQLGLGLQILNPASNLLGPLGSIGFGLLGGLIGSAFEEPTDKIINAVDSNTDAIEANTDAILDLGRTIINAPSRYQLPVFKGDQGFGINISQININSSTGDPDKIYKDFVDRLNREYSRNISSGYTRSRMF